MNGKVDLDLKKLMAIFDGTESAATRAASGTVLQSLADALPSLVGGSADLGPSNKTEMKGKGSSPREHRKAAISTLESANMPWAVSSMG